MTNLLIADSSVCVAVLLVHSELSSRRCTVYVQYITVLYTAKHTSTPLPDCRLLAIAELSHSHRQILTDRHTWQCCYGELAISSLVVATTIASTHFHPPTNEIRNDQAELTLVTSYIPRWFTHPQIVTHPSTNPAAGGQTTNKICREN